MATKKEIAKALDDPKLRAQLEEMGYSVRRDPSELVTKSFKLPKSLASEFYRVVRDKGLKVQDAAEQALSDWIKANRS